MAFHLLKNSFKKEALGKIVCRHIMLIYLRTWDSTYLFRGSDFFLANNLPAIKKGSRKEKGRERRREAKVADLK